MGSSTFCKKAPKTDQSGPMTVHSGWAHTGQTFSSLPLCPPCSWPVPCSPPPPSRLTALSPSAGCTAPCSVVHPLCALEQWALVPLPMRQSGLERVFPRGRHQLARETFAYPTEPPRAKVGLERKDCSRTEREGGLSPARGQWNRFQLGETDG